MQTTNRWDLINYIIRSNNYRRYLEIGVALGHNFNQIICSSKTGVDPSPTSVAGVKLSSDQFFAENKLKFDCIFIDGLHHYDQFKRDVKNAMKVMDEGGTIICHDINPTSEAMQEVPRIQKVWTGDVWKAWVRLRQGEKKYSFTAVDICYGCGVIQKLRPGQERETASLALIPKRGMLTYSMLEDNRKQYLNLVSWQEFVQGLWPPAPELHTSKPAETSDK